MFTAVSKHNNEVCLLPSGLVCLIVGPLSRVRILFLKSWVNLIHKKTPLNHSAVLVWNLDLASTRSIVEVPLVLFGLRVNVVFMSYSKRKKN